MTLDLERSFNELRRAVDGSHRPSIAGLRARARRRRRVRVLAWSTACCCIVAIAGFAVRDLTASPDTSLDLATGGGRIEELLQAHGMQVVQPQEVVVEDLPGAIEVDRRARFDAPREGDRPAVPAEDAFARVRFLGPVLAAEPPTTSLARYTDASAGADQARLVWVTHWQGLVTPDSGLSRDQYGEILSGRMPPGVELDRFIRYHRFELVDALTGELVGGMVVTDDLVTTSGTG